MNHVCMIINLLPNNKVPHFCMHFKNLNPLACYARDLWLPLKLVTAHINTAGTRRVEMIRKYASE